MERYAFAEQWVRSVKQECLSKLIRFGETSLKRAVDEFIAHYHFERNHQGKGNLLLFHEPQKGGGGNVSNAGRDLVDCLSTTLGSHEHFDHWGPPALRGKPLI